MRKPGFLLKAWRWYVDGWNLWDDPKVWFVSAGALATGLALGTWRFFDRLPEFLAVYVLFWLVAGPYMARMAKELQFAPKPPQIIEGKR